MSLAELTKQLRDGRVHALNDDFLILNVILASIRQHRGPRAGRRLVYYTLDHRRLKCMKDAGCTQVRVCILIADSLIVSNFINKGIERIGLRTEIAVNRRRYA